MKVCTDACIQGALSGKEVRTLKPASVLDIGAGTGLLSLMLAQNGPFSHQEAIEIDRLACAQARQNIKTAAFAHNIRLVHGDVRAFRPERHYDFIICNPPFYERDLKSPSMARNQAMHSSHLSVEDLPGIMTAWLQPEGVASLMVPTSIALKWLDRMSRNGLYPYKITALYNSADKAPFRSLFFLKKQKVTVERERLVIRTGSNAYTRAFMDLLAPYYLHF